MKSFRLPSLGAANTCTAFSLSDSKLNHDQSHLIWNLTPGKTCCRSKRQREEPPVGLEAGSQLKSQGKWLGVGRRSLCILASISAPIWSCSVLRFTLA